MKIYKSFAFDQNIPQADYEKYINPDDLLNESYEELKGEFKHYRTKKGRDIIKQEMEMRKQLQMKRKKNQSGLVVQPKKHEEHDNQKDMLGNIVREEMQINQKGSAVAYIIEYRHAANFGQDYTTMKQKIQKTDVTKQPIFSQEDFAKLIQREDEDELIQTQIRTMHKPREGFKSRFIEKQIPLYKNMEQSSEIDSKKQVDSKILTKSNKTIKQFGLQQSRESPSNAMFDGEAKRISKSYLYKTWFKGEETQNKKYKKPRRTESYHKAAAQREEIKSQLKERAQVAFKRYESMGKTWEKFGVFSQDILDFRMQTLKEAKIQRLLLEQQEHDLTKVEQNEQRDTDMLTRLVKVITKPNSDNKEEVKTNFEYHEQRLKDMRTRTRQIQRAGF
ncbi:unnamed protein product [Paramecium octaurelia]|uniref:Uncharacterized protein n=1 Tax=Paramecium octaurelia TaxID=43137 RepID=A0A8S1WHC8_PAROT|nr:unnamed protein product [Paramecium octaurelia]